MLIHNLLIFFLGIRAIQINDRGRSADILLEEVNYLQNCVELPIGIFVENYIFKDLTKVIEDLDYNIWPIKSSRKLSFQRYSLLMQQLPWNDKLESVEIIPDEDVEDFRDFMAAVKEEKICLMHFKSTRTLYVLLNHESVRDFKEGHVFVVLEGGMEEGLVKGKLFYKSVHKKNLCPILQFFHLANIIIQLNFNENVG